MLSIHHAWQGAYYEAVIAVPHVEGFWFPHVEQELTSELFETIADAMDWMANHPASYEEDASTSLTMWIDGHCEVLWEFSPHFTVRTRPR